MGFTTGAAGFSGSAFKERLSEAFMASSPCSNASKVRGASAFSYPASFATALSEDLGASDHVRSTGDVPRLPDTLTAAPGGVVSTCNTKGRALSVRRRGLLPFVGVSSWVTG